MTKEEKAKAYDEAIEKAKKINNEHKAQPFDIMLKVFPELAESEDEKIRRKLLGYFKDQDAQYTFRGLTNAEVIASLEKQKGQKPEQYSPLCNTIKDKIREYIANHFIADTVVKTDMRSIVKAMEEGVRFGKEEQKPAEIDEYEIIKKHITRDSLSSEVNKRLKECGWYVTDEKPAEWSEEDRDMMESIIDFVEKGIIYRHSRASMKVWLKSLRPQPHWKPTEEQMEAMESAVKLYKDTHFEIHHEKIVSLYEQLKKLM